MKHIRTTNSDEVTYIALNPSNKLYKIGKTTKSGLKRRMKSLETASGAPISVVHLIESPIEELLHEDFRKKRVFGEWFKLTSSDISYLKKIKPKPADSDETSYELIQLILTGRKVEYSAKEIKAIRRSLLLNRSQFAALLNVGKSALTKWEQGIRTPTPSAMRLFQFIEVMAHDTLSRTGASS